MKQFFLASFLFVYVQSYSQGGSVQSVSGSTSTKAEDFNTALNNYVWSHNNYKIGKGDKPVMEFKDIESYQGIGTELAISPDGEYFAYSILNMYSGKLDSLVIQATSGRWRQSLTSGSPGFFSADGKLYIFQDKEELCFLKTADGRINKVKDVVSFQRPYGDKGQFMAFQLKNAGATLVLRDLMSDTDKRFDSVAGFGFDTPLGANRKPAWLACQLNNEKKELLIHNLSTGQEKRFESVIGYSFDNRGQVLVLKRIERSTKAISLQYVNLGKDIVNALWNGKDSATIVTSFVIDETGKQVVFVVQETDKTSNSDQPTYSIWYYRAGTDKAVLRIAKTSSGMESGLVPAGSVWFSDNGRYIFVELQYRQVSQLIPDPNAVKLDVWSYKDTNLQSSQPYLLKFQQARPELFTAVIPVEGGQLMKLTREFENLIVIKGDFAIIGKRGGKNGSGQVGFMGDRFWEAPYGQDSSWIVSLKDGSRRIIKTKSPQVNDIFFSPQGRYVVYPDAENQFNYFSIDLITGKVANISAGIAAWQLGKYSFNVRSHENPSEVVGIAAWLEGEAGLLVYDNYDIWQLDLEGKKPPINATNNYGIRNQIQLRLTEPRVSSLAPVLSPKSSLLLKGFNGTNKYEGFYRKALGKAGNPELLYTGPCKLDMTSSVSGNNYRSHKAADADIWIVIRQTARQAPNYFLTRDFRNYEPLTDLQQHKNYNWFTSELHSFKQMDGTTSQGVLYKPENFDSSKKYPVLIVFYSVLSDEVHVFHNPKLISSPSSPKESPGWMTSHGYLVFTPDIYFAKNQWGPSAINTVEGAARYLSSLSFVDGKRMGACGHSNSGRTAYYILTHSKSFAAMSVGASQSNIISAALSLNKPQAKEESYLQWFEQGSHLSGLGNLWENKELWIDHSAAIQADKVTSPVLLFHNDKDGHPLGQVIEIFISLRRLEKKAWWLNYNNSGHVVRGKDGKDFTIRYTQFFDHYLKGAPPPRWMTQGIPNKYKQIESRYELDPDGSCGEDCTICKAKKY